MKWGMKKNDSDIGECNVGANTLSILQYIQRKLEAKSRSEEEGNWEGAEK